MSTARREVVPNLTERLSLADTVVKRHT